MKAIALKAPSSEVLMATRESRGAAPRSATPSSASPSSASPSLVAAAPASRAASKTAKKSAVGSEKVGKFKADDELDGDVESAKKRVRLKPETREQLLERLRNPELSLHEASILLRVSRATVRRYADANRLTCQRTAGGQRRFFLRDIEMFYRQLKARK